MDKATHEKIRSSLRIILGEESGCLPDAIACLDELKANVEGHLAHYLHNRSYAKALLFLEEQGDPSDVS